MESHATPLGVQCQIKASPDHAPRLAFNSRGKSLKNSLIALSKDQVSISESEPKSFVEFCKVCSGCIVWTLVISVGCSILGFYAASGLCLLLCIYHNHRTDYQIMKKKMYIFFPFSCETVWIFRLSASLRESEDADLEEEGVGDNLRLLLFLDLCLFLHWSLLEIHPEREACKVCCPISSCCQTVRLQHWDQTYY